MSERYPPYVPRVGFQSEIPADQEAQRVESFGLGVGTRVRALVRLGTYEPFNVVEPGALGTVIEDRWKTQSWYEVLVQFDGIEGDAPISPSHVEVVK
jgi:hypothetical protein